MLMIKVLSNNEILSYLYDRIFSKRSAAEKTTQASQREKEEKLPKINFNLRY